MDTHTQNGHALAAIHEPETAHYSAVVDGLLQKRADYEQRLWHAKLSNYGLLILLGMAIIGCLWAWRYAATHEPGVQYVQVDEHGAFQILGVPLRMSAYEPQEAQWTKMVREFILHFRTHSSWAPQNRQAWLWLELHSCGAAAKRLKEYLDREKPLEVKDVTVQVDITDVTRIDIPLAFYASWNERRSEQHGAEKVSRVTGTFLVGRRKVSTKAMMDTNPFGLCVDSFNLGA